MPATDPKKSGTTQDALDLLKQVDPARFAEVDSFAPIAWLAQIVSQFRSDRGMSQTAMANALGTTQPTVSRLESGEVDPSFSRACEALAILGHRFVPVPLADEPVFVVTLAELQQTVHTAIESMLPQIEKKALSDALVQVADAGIASVPTMDISAFMPVTSRGAKQAV